MKTKTKLWIGTVVGLVVVVGLLGGVKAAQIGSMIKAGKSFVPPPESVATAKVETVEWAATRAAVGTLVAVRGVTLSAELPGTVREIGFESGTFVRKGTLLVKLDTSAEEAQLAAASADASLAHLSLERARALRQAGSNAQADLDAAEARAKQADAAVATLQATIAKKTIRAPFDGRIAIRQVELGQVLSPGNPIASLQSVSPIHAEFWLPQQSLAQLRLGERVRLRVDIFPGSSWEGELTTINPEVDVATRNVRVRATFENGDGRLRPGMFANVEVISSEKRQILVVPATAVIFAPYGDSVFVLEEKGEGPAKAQVARQRSVRLG
ncbi:MAG TPA: efflux RND transporter periplasmic adaptor subunit, partial [Anaeromyxobacteraceae bacterium]|nr:efflux RND transporter periplasmic adaptor subunit [Anaeromyxobacteraceae bacterium]